jgi:hypothetical protein
MISGGGKGEGERGTKNRVELYEAKRKHDKEIWKE